MGFRKRRRPTPGFKIPSPYNPIQGEQANLRQDGTSPYCAMMQVVEEDTYADYVICRGFDTRILKYIDNISVAKPFGKRVVGTYQVGEVYPAFLPTQGNDEFADFRQVTYVPPSPNDVLWRVGQNPGVVDGGGLEGGQPEDLSDKIEILYDHNGKVVNWMLIDSAKPGTNETRIAIFELILPLAPGVGETATATTILHNDPDLGVGAGIVVYNTGDATGYATAHGIAIKVKVADAYQWWVLEINQFCLFYTVKLTADTHSFNISNSPISGSYADQTPFTYDSVKELTPYPFSYYETQDIENPFNKHGKSGDTLLIAHVEDGYTFQIGEADPITTKNIIVDVLPAQARQFFARYTEDVPTGDYMPTTAAIGAGPIGNNSGEIPSIVAASDLFHLSWNGKNNMNAAIAYNFTLDTPVIMNSQHWATRVKATVTDDFCDTPTDFQVDVVDGMNGLKPTGPLTVQNRYSMRGAKAGDPIDVLFDQHANEWYPERTKPPGATIEYVIVSVDQATGGPYTGLVVATVTIKGASCGLECLIGTTAEVVDHSGCIFDEPEMIGYTGWAFEGVFASLASGAACTDLTPCHWAAFNRCCAPGSGTYADPCYGE